MRLLILEVKEESKSKFSGRLMSEESYKEWRKAFKDIEESIMEISESQEEVSPKKGKVK